MKIAVFIDDEKPNDFYCKEHARERKDEAVFGFGDFVIAYYFVKNKDLNLCSCGLRTNILIVDKKLMKRDEFKESILPICNMPPCLTGFLDTETRKVV